MNRRLALMSVLVIGLMSTTGSVFAQTPVAATPDSAASFVGNWALSAQGDQGAAQFALTVKVDAGKVVASISMGQGDQPITDISLNGKTLVMKYFVDYQGSQIDTVLSLTQDGDKATMQMTFAGGAYTMSGTAEKKA